MSADPEKHTLTAETAKKGAYIRPATKFHNKVSASVEADADGVFKAEAGRYHIYVSLACPWAHRTLVVRALKGLEEVISVSTVDPYLTSFSDSEGYKGWSFTEKYPDPHHRDTTCTYDLYRMSDPEYPRKYLSVPIFWDKKTDRIVNNESSQIIEFLNSEFNEFAKNPDLNLAPEDLRAAMDEVNDLVYPNINDGVYRSGFAKTQEAYDDAVANLFDALDKVEVILSKSRYLTGDRFTLSDVRLWTTLVRFDSVYYSHFKCSRRRLTEYKNLWGFVRDVYQMTGVADTTDIEHIKFHYFHSHRGINPRGIVPTGPALDFEAKHDRDRFSKSEDSASA